MSLRALIFDVDGTLADTELAGHRVAFNGAFAEAGLPWFWDQDRYDELLQVAGGKERMRVVERLGVDPGDCLAVEDSGPGLTAARAAGAPTVVTPSAQASRDDLSAALARYTDLSGVHLDDLRTLHAGTAVTHQT